jgi:bifunctional non-homologous end joining protein LigD
VPKNRKAAAPAWLSQTLYKGKNRLLLNNKATLIWVANSALELHVPFDIYTKGDHPTELVLDLDPTEVENIEQVREIALILKEVLDSLGLWSLPKTSGKSGLHIHVPIAPIYTFEQCRVVNQFLAKYIAEKYPAKVTLERVVSNRGSKLYLDFLQLWKGRTLPAPYSVRAISRATVATPLDWHEVETFNPNDFNLLNIVKRLAVKVDLLRPLTEDKPKYETSLETILTFIARNN